MARGLAKVSPKPAMPYPSMPCGRATPETAVFNLFNTPRHIPNGYPANFFPEKKKYDGIEIKLMICRQAWTSQF
jgi:hypothetical protein